MSIEAQQKTILMLVPSYLTHQLSIWPRTINAKSIIIKVKLDKKLDLAQTWKYKIPSILQVNFPIPVEDAVKERISKNMKSTNQFKDLKPIIALNKTSSHFVIFQNKLQ